MRVAISPRAGDFVRKHGAHAYVWGEGSALRAGTEPPANAPPLERLLGDALEIDVARDLVEETRAVRVCLARWPRRHLCVRDASARGGLFWRAVATEAILGDSGPGSSSG